MSFSQITITPVLPSWLIALLLFLGLGMTVLQYWLIRQRVDQPRALIISLLRLGTFFLLISFFLNPALIEKSEHRVAPSLAILVDTSESMDLPGHKEKGSRLDEVKSLLLKEPSFLLKSLSDKFDVRLFALGESLKTVEAREVATIHASGKRGDLTGALKGLSGKSSAAILLSDGNLKWEGSNSSDIPVFVIPVGDPEGYRDLLIKTVKAPALAFRGREVVVDVTIKGYGYAGVTLPIVLKDGTRLLTAKNVHINSNLAETTVPLSFIPEEIGNHDLSLSIPPQYGESLTSNNIAHFSVKVVRDKIRILMVSGSPSLSYRFMRTAFKSDPSVDLLSFVILRTPSDVMNVPLQEQSLIPFPVETLFSKELKNFDLVIFDNFPYNLYLRSSYIEGLRTFLREGGGFALIGGPSFSTEGGYTESAMGEILPVRLSGREDYRRDSPFGVKLSQSGLLHPITRLSVDEGDNSSLWKEMPAIDGVNLLEAKASGMVLLESNDGTSRPILTIGGYGKGRILTLATDSSWRWYMGMVAKGKGNLAYLRLMERMIRWLTKDPSLDPLQITLPENSRIAEEYEVRIKLGQEGLTPNLKGSISLNVFDPDGAKIGSRIKSAGQPGEFLGSFRTEKGGIYKVKVDSPSGHQEESLVVALARDDLDASPDHDRLKMISASTGGKALFNAQDLLKEMDDYAGRRGDHFTEERRPTLWGRPYILAFILLLLTAGWYLRRRWGLA